MAEAFPINPAINFPRPVPIVPALAILPSSTAPALSPAASPRDRVGDATDGSSLDAIAERLADASPEDVIAAAADRHGDGLVVATSFGIQAAVTLHMATRVVPGIPILWVDTGYLPEETYRFAEALTERLDLNLQVFQSPISPARMEAAHGKLWEVGTADALDQYDRIRKVEPLRRGLGELAATAWISGLRAEQTEFRKTLRRVESQGAREKFHPILGWNARDVHGYLKQHDLPVHPLFDQGYATVGDSHSSRPAGAEDAHERDSRFGGLKQECGIHLSEDEDESFVSSRL